MAKSRRAPHAGRIGAERHVDERPKLGESDDVVHPLGDFLFAKAEIKPAQLDVLAAGELGIDAEAAAEQRCGLANDLDPAGLWDINACEHAQERALAGAVPPDETDTRAMLDREIDAVERADRDPMACVSADTSGRVAPHAAAGDHRHGAPLQRAAARVVDGEADGDV